jgi:hypothetical protein
MIMHLPSSINCREFLDWLRMCSTVSVIFDCNDLLRAPIAKVLMMLLLYFRGIFISVLLVALRGHV